MYPSSRAIATSWFGINRFDSYRKYSSKLTDEVNKDGTNVAKAETNTQSADTAPPASSAEKQPDYANLELQLKKQIDDAVSQNALKIKQLESRIENLESRTNISKDKRQVGEIESRLWLSVWVLLLLFIIFKV